MRIILTAMAATVAALALGRNLAVAETRLDSMADLAGRPAGANPLDT